MRSNVRVNRGEEFNPENSQRIFANSTAFVFPTLGENFGHVIAEALSVGCPVLLTADSPWRDLVNNGAGKIIDSDKQAAAQLRAWSELTYEDQIALRESVHSIYRRWFANHIKASNPFAMIYPKVERQ